MFPAQTHPRDVSLLREARGLSWPLALPAREEPVCKRDDSAVVRSLPDSGVSEGV